MFAVHIKINTNNATSTTVILPVNKLGTGKTRWNVYLPIRLGVGGGGNSATAKVTFKLQIVISNM